MLVLPYYLIKAKGYRLKILNIIDALSIILRLLGEELEAASQLVKAWSRIEPVELYDEEQ